MIRLSKKYGLNPSLDTCILCGESKGIALLGNNCRNERGFEVEAPKQIVTNCEPCEDCQKKLTDFVLIYEAEKYIDGKTKITGNYLTMHKHDFKVNFKEYKGEKIIMMESKVFQIVKNAILEFNNKSNDNVG